MKIVVTVAIAIDPKTVRLVCRIMFFRHRSLLRHEIFSIAINF